MEPGSVRISCDLPVVRSTLISFNGKKGKAREIVVLDEFAVSGLCADLQSTRSGGGGRAVF